MEEKKQEKLPIDAKLLSDAIIELNISRRSVGLYPPDHPIVEQSIARAFELLQKLFELRSSITLGIAKETLIIDEYSLDKKNPVFSEFALSLHDKGIAAITFFNGLETNDLITLHELITMKEGPTGKALLENAEKKGLRHVKLSLIDLSSFGFVEGSLKPSTLEPKLWEDYIYGLLQGKLAASEAEGIVLTITPEQIASVVNSNMSEDAPDETYDRVISSYLSRKGKPRLSKESFERFLSFVKNLNPELKSQFLNRALSMPSYARAEIDMTLSQLKEDDIQKMIEVFQERSSILPESLMNIIDKLEKVKPDSKTMSQLSSGAGSLVDDIELDDSIVRLLEDSSSSFVGDGYKRELEVILKGLKAEESTLLEQIGNDCTDKVIDLTISDTTLELLESDSISSEDFLKLLTKLSELTDTFLDTGRFQEISYIYNAIYSHSLSGRFKVEALSMINHFFRSEQFIEKLLYALKMWGRHDREGAVSLSKVLKFTLINPLFDTLAAESNPTVRKFFLHVLSNLGSDILPEVNRRLNDERWYVVRNMIYLIRECSSGRYQKDYVHKIRKFTRDKNTKVCMEAVKTLLAFGTRDGPSYIKHYLRSKDLEQRQQAVMLSGSYKVKSAVPYLLDLLNKKDPFGTEAYTKILVVKALSDIGDTRGIKQLLRLCRSRTLLHRSIYEELKVEIFRSLKNYPQDAIKPFLELGTKSKNEEIRSISENLSKKYLSIKGEESD